jgi:hypothetical protein
MQERVQSARVSTQQITTDHILSTRQILERRMGVNCVHQLLVHLQRDYDLGTKLGMYNTVIDFGVPKEPVRVI